MSITYTRVTWYSQLIAIVIFVGVFYLGMHLGAAKAPETSVPDASSVASGKAIAAVSYSCPAGQYISALYYENGIRIMLSDGREYSLPHAISADGARYADADESFVFWSRGKTAFTMEKGTIAWSDCNVR